MACRFLRKDYDALIAKTEKLSGELEEAGEEEGRWANQSAETWHDNFGYEQEEQQQWAVNDAEIVDQRLPDEVDIGAEVTIRDAQSGEQKTFVIGSYQVLDQQHANQTRTPRRSPGH